MPELKDTKQAKVRIGYDGQVHKWYHGPMAKERYENEIRVLKYLQSQGCNFVPRVLEQDDEKLYLVTTNCGRRVDKVSQGKVDQLFQALEQFGVEHGDPFERNITYNDREGRFCIIDFEFASIIATGEGLTLEEVEKFHRAKIEREAREKL